MKSLKFVLNFSSVIVVLFVNYYSQTGKINNQTVGSLSNEYDNLFTPSSYAFAIWGIIFLGLIAYAIYHGVVLLKSSDRIVLFERSGFLFALVNLGNALWVIAWLYEFTFLSVLIMVGMLIGLASLVKRISPSIHTMSFVDRLFGWWPITIYAGWITVATIANISAFLSKKGWDGGFMSEVSWTIVMIAIAVIVNIYVTWKMSTKLFSLVGIWAIFAIYNRHQSTYDTLAAAAIACLSVLIVSTLFKVFKEQRIMYLARSK